jgi:hypothetical protein
MTCRFASKDSWEKSYDVQKQSNSTIKWQNTFERLVAYKKEHGHCNFPKKYNDGRNPHLGKWAGNQRTNYFNGSLSQERVKQLESIGFEWNLHKIGWTETFERLVAYKKEHGHCNIPRNYNDGRKPHLGMWANTQRTTYFNESLSQERVKQLESVGFEWNPRKMGWTETFDRLVTYKKESGHCNVPVNYNDGRNPHLGVWVSNQRTMYLNGSLSRERVKQLESIEFEWNLQNMGWTETLERLVAYKKESGHCNVPTDYNDGRNPHLGMWAGSQRTKYFNGSLSQERVKQLESVGFKWNPRKMGWTETFDRLVTYKKEGGHCNVPTNYNDGRKPHLGIWVISQRKKYFDGSLIQERIELLESVGFEWNPRKMGWTETFDRLIAYKKQNGHCYVPRSRNDGGSPHLGKWVSKQREKYFDGSLIQERIELLESVGFKWNPRKKMGWTETFDRLVA